MLRAAGKPVVIGGTFFEAVFAQGQGRRLQALAAASSASRTSRSPTASIDMPRERKLELIAEFARDFTVLSEVGSKDSEVVFAPYQWVEWIKEELARGRLEGDHRGPRGRHRRHLPPERRDAHRARRRDRRTRSPSPT